MLFFPFYLFAEWACFIISLLLIKKSDAKFWRVLKLYLLSVVVVETAGRYLTQGKNQWLYNVDAPIEFVFGIWVLSKIAYSKKTRYIFVVSYLVFFWAYGIELCDALLKKNTRIAKTDFFNNTSTIGSTIIIGLCILYYYMLFEKEKYIELQKEASFWFVSGSFIFYATNIGIEVFFKKIDTITYLIIINILNVILYGCWIISFTCLKNERKSLQK